MVARHSILLNFNPQIDIKTINPPSFIDSTGNNLIIKDDDIRNELAQCVSIVQSVPNETQLVINMISYEGKRLLSISFINSSIFTVYDIKEDLSDGILALLLSLETFINSFQFNWISSSIEGATKVDWLEVFPFINFVKYSNNGSSIQIPNTFSPTAQFPPLNRTFTIVLLYICTYPCHSYLFS